MMKKVASLLFVGLLSMASGCSKTEQGSAISAPAVEAASVAPAPPALPAVSGHWTITFTRLRYNKEDVAIPGSGKNIGVLNVDMKDGVNVKEANYALCTQNGIIYNQYGLPNVNMSVPLDDGKFERACFTSASSFAGSSGRLTHTTVVLMRAKLEQRAWKDTPGEKGKVPASTMGRPVDLRIRIDDSFSSTTMLDADTAISGNMMSGHWCDTDKQQYCGTLTGQRASD